MSKFPNSSASLQRRLDPICDTFEEAWKEQDRAPEIADFLSRAAEPDRMSLAVELLLLDVFYRRAQGQNLSQEEYLELLPDMKDAIQRAFISTFDPYRTRFEIVSGSEEETIHSANASESGTFPVAGERVRYFGDYELIDEIARGGMGVVYRAKQISLNRVIALKMILSGQIAGEDAVLRFQVEAEAAANLDHPGIVPIYDIGQHENQHYYSMKLIDGKTLSQLSDACCCVGVGNTNVSYQ